MNHVVIFTAIALAASVCAVRASAADPTPNRPDCPSWRETHYYPEKAQRNGVDGKVVLTCTVTAEGHLTGCAIVSEEPANQGFGRQAVQTAECWMKPRGATPLGSITFPMEYHLPR